MQYRQVQQIAKDTIEYIKTKIKPGMSLIELREKCEQKMLELGADSFWYWDVGAFFTFEPHISIAGSKYGYKMENIYYFENGQLVEL